MKTETKRFTVEQVAKAWEEGVLQPIFNSWFELRGGYGTYQDEGDEKRYVFVPEDDEDIQPCGCGLTSLAVSAKPELLPVLTNTWLYENGYKADGSLVRQGEGNLIAAAVLSSLEELGYHEPLFTGFVAAYDASPVMESPPRAIASYRADTFVHEWSVFNPKTGTNRYVEVTPEENERWWQAYQIGVAEGKAARAWALKHEAES